MNFPQTNKDLFRLLKKETPAEEQVLIEFLILNRLIDATSVCTNASCTKKHNNKLQFWKQGKTKNLYYRCKKCYTRWSARNNIFNYKENSNMPITKIIELIWYFVKSPRYPIKEICKEIDVDKKVVIQWFRKIREYLYFRLLTAPPMGGEGKLVQKRSTHVLPLRQVCINAHPLRQDCINVH